MKKNTKISKKPNFYDPSVGSQKKNFLKTKKYRYLLADRLGPYLIIELVAGPVSILQQEVLNIKNPKRILKELIHLIMKIKQANLIQNI